MMIVMYKIRYTDFGRKKEEIAKDKAAEIPISENGCG